MRGLVAVLLLVVAVPASASPTDCNAVVSMSQGGQVYAGSALGSGERSDSELEALTGEQWMLLFQGGKTLPWFTVAANWVGLGVRHRCGSDSDIDSIIFIFDPRQSGSNNGTDMIANLGLVESIVASRYPNATFHPTMLVGAVNHVDCSGNGQVASSTHADRIATLQSSQFEVGPDLDVPCVSYQDPLGHLTNAGAAAAQSQVAAWFNG